MLFQAIALKYSYLRCYKMLRSPTHTSAFRVLGLGFRGLGFRAPDVETPALAPEHWLAKTSKETTLHASLVFRV